MSLVRKCDVFISTVLIVLSEERRKIIASVLSCIEKYPVSQHLLETVVVEYITKQYVYRKNIPSHSICLEL
ncbi:hypothetical protein J6590_029099 [Homalodisca vitripennis]|nr:hypothetical protein J6590_029099 [Homalodisca vitripennis]